MSSKGKRDRIGDDFYETPAWVAREMLRQARQVFGAQIRHYHDPFAGRGGIIGPLRQMAPPSVTCSVTELDPTRAKMAAREAGGDETLLGFDAYETKVSLPKGTVLMMNPPFDDPMRALTFAAVVDQSHDCWDSSSVLGTVALGPVSWRHSEDRRLWWKETGLKGFRKEVPLPHRPCFAWPCNGKVVVDGERKKCPKIYPPNSDFLCPHCRNGRPKPATDSVEYSIYVWDRSYEGSPMVDLSMAPIPVEFRKRHWFAVNEGLEHVLDLAAVEEQPSPEEEAKAERESEASSSDAPEARPKESQPEPEVSEVSEVLPEAPAAEAPAAEAPEAPAEDQVAPSLAASLAEALNVANPKKRRGRPPKPTAPEPKDDVLEGSEERVAAHAAKLMEAAVATGETSCESLVAGWLEGPSKHFRVKLSKERLEEIARSVLTAPQPEPSGDHEDALSFFPSREAGEPSRKGRALILAASAASVLAKAHYEEESAEEAVQQLVRFHARQPKDGLRQEAIQRLAGAITKMPADSIQWLVDALRAPPGSRFCSECGLPQKQCGAGWDCHNNCGGTSLDLSGEVY